MPSRSIPEEADGVGTVSLVTITLRCPGCGSRTEVSTNFDGRHTVLRDLRVVSAYGTAEQAEAGAERLAKALCRERGYARA